MDTDKTLKSMAQWAVASATQSLAAHAREFAEDPRVKEMNGAEALEAFARAIETTNAKVFPRA